MLPLLSKIETVGGFPSPPAIAQQIIALAGDSDVDVARLAMVIGQDPSLAAKVLRVANSPLYQQRRQSSNLRQALVVLGVNSAITLALGFSLISAYETAGRGGLDYAKYWQRAILCATAAKLFGTLAGSTPVDSLFLAGLLQDIGVLAIDRVEPDFYAELPPGAPHQEIAAYECSRIGVDHAMVGGHLLRHWKLPELLCELTESSHAPDDSNSATVLGRSLRSLALGNQCVDLLQTTPSLELIESLAQRAQALLGLSRLAVNDALGQLLARLPEFERLFETSLLPPEVVDSVLEQARELLTVRSLEAYRQANELQAATEHLRARTRDLEQQGRHDALTGAFNRGYLDEVLEREFHAATDGGWPLALIFADLDRFKVVNDTYGHPAGDIVLAATARLLRAMVRDSDCVARYGGEEFVVVLPGLGQNEAVTLCNRLMAQIRRERHSIGGDSVSVTVSLGLAVHTAASPFSSMKELLETADRCVYEAKRAGRDQLVMYEPQRAAVRRPA